MIIFELEWSTVDSANDRSRFGAISGNYVTPRLKRSELYLHRAAAEKKQGELYAAAKSIETLELRININERLVNEDSPNQDNIPNPKGNESV